LICYYATRNPDRALDSAALEKSGNMCTVSWLRHSNGYVLLCNRDERHTRQPALGPRINQREGVSFIAPVDGDHGGSWIAVNQFGLTLCLLNRYGDEPVDEADGYISRGLLLIKLIHCATAASVRSRIESTNLEEFRPFTLAVISLADPSFVLDWTGRELRVRSELESHAPLTSSSLREPEIGISRREQFQQLISEAVDEEPSQMTDLLWQFHRSHLPERGPTSVCMHRAEASTVSVSAVTVGRKSIEFAYQPGSPCTEAPLQTVVLARSADCVKAHR
jgi:hypothetical protein